MIHTHEYDTSYHPAMPIIEVHIRGRIDQTPIVLKAIVDSGADATVIPLLYLKKLKARKGRTRWLRGMTGISFEVDLYTTAIQIGNSRSIYVDVVGSELPDEVIVGRDILNQFIVNLNAPAHTVEISE